MKFSISQSNFLSFNFQNNIKKIPKFMKLNNISEKEIETILEIILEQISPKMKIIGRQVKLTHIQDVIDLIALDEYGNIVVIDAKRNCLLPGTDFQILKYASYLSKWTYSDIKKQTTYYYNKKHNTSDFDFQNFLKNLLLTKEINLNQKQKMLIMGTGNNNKLFSVIRYLQNYNLDINFLKLKFFELNNNIILDIEPIIPYQSINKMSNIKPQTDTITSKYQHLKGCSKNNKKTVKFFNNIIKNIYQDIEGPIWDKQAYVSFNLYGRKFLDYRINQNSIRITVHSYYRNLYKKQEIYNLLCKEIGNEKKVNISYNS